MPLSFRRRATPVEEPASDPDAVEEVEPGLDDPDEASRRGYTPSKKERGIPTPKRPSPQVRRPDATAAPAGKAAGKGRRLSRGERRELKEERRRRRREATDGMKRGDERYLGPRDKGPERKIARDVVDSRPTVGTWFFAGALFVLLFSGAAMPPQVRLVANLAWAVLAIAVITDSWLLCRKTKRLIRQRQPDSSERMGALYFYVIMRSLTFRKLRIPQPGRKFGEQI